MAAALEVMDRFSDFLRGWVTDQEELKRIYTGCRSFSGIWKSDGEAQGTGCHQRNDFDGGHGCLLHRHKEVHMTLTKKLTKSEFRQRADKI